jgi:hypothetical protein
MSLPTRDNILTMDYSGDGSPWVKVAAKSGIELDGLDWSLDGSPWWGLKVEEIPVSYIPKIICIS